MKNLKIIATGIVIAAASAATHADVSIHTVDGRRYVLRSSGFSLDDSRDGLSVVSAAVAMYSKGGAYQGLARLGVYGCNDTEERLLWNGPVGGAPVTWKRGGNRLFDALSSAICDMSVAEAKRVSSDRSFEAFLGSLRADMEAKQAANEAMRKAYADTRAPPPVIPRSLDINITTQDLGGNPRPPLPLR